MNSYKFYTYDASGKNIVIVVEAFDIEHAWEIFEAKYNDYYVDQCLDMVESSDPGEIDPGEMDGDAESALASAGFGTDEDYGYYGDE